MSSLSTRATQLATVLLATLVGLLSTALPVSAAGRSAPLKLGVQQPATIVTAHVSSAVKEMYLHSLAEALAAAGGLGALVFGNRNFGASDGEPPAMMPLAGPRPMAVSALPTPVTGSSSTWARHGRDDESQELSGGGESHVS